MISWVFTARLSISSSDRNMLWGINRLEKRNHRCREMVCRESYVSLFWSLFCEIIGPAIWSIPGILIPDAEPSANLKENKQLIVLVRSVLSNQSTCLLALSMWTTTCLAFTMLESSAQILRQHAIISISEKGKRQSSQAWLSCIWKVANLRTALRGCHVYN